MVAAPTCARCSTRPSLPAARRRLRDETGALRRHVNVFVGDTNIRDGAGLAEPLPDGAEIQVIPAVSGG